MAAPGVLGIDSTRTIWHCDPNMIVCRDGHPLLLYKSGYRGDDRGLVGHAFRRCMTCRPTTPFFALFIVHPSPLVVCYLLSEDSYEEWRTRGGDETPATQELLYLLRDPDGRSYNPNWRPPQ